MEVNDLEINGPTLKPRDPYELRTKNIKEWLKNSPSRDPGAYLISNTSYKRNNAAEREFNQRFKWRVLRIYDCRCAICGSDQEGIEMDHFWIPKARGGNLYLQIKNSTNRICNAVPLCITCNRTKQEDNLNLDDLKLATIAMKNHFASAVINGVSPKLPAGLSDYRPSDEPLFSKVIYLKAPGEGASPLDWVRYVRKISEWLLTSIRHLRWRGPEEGMTLLDL